MRELVAKLIALATGLLIVLIAIGFAWIQNRDRRKSYEYSQEAHDISAAELDRQTIHAGMEVYEAQACAACHSIAGKGHLRHPLDGVGGRLPEAEIRAWIAPHEGMSSMLPARAYKTKQQYNRLPPDQMDALLQYMRSLK